MGRIKPDNKSVYYGLIMAEKAIVAVIKNDAIITVIPSGNLFLLNQDSIRYPVDP